MKQSSKMQVNYIAQDTGSIQAPEGRAKIGKKGAWRL